MNFENRRIPSEGEARLVPHALADWPREIAQKFKGKANGAAWRQAEAFILTLLAIAIAAAVPYWFASNEILIGSSRPGADVLTDTAIASLFAMLLGYPIVRTLLSYPQIRSVSYVLVTFSVTFALVAAIEKYLVIVNLGTQYVLSLMIVVALTSLYLVIGRNLRPYNFAVVPGGVALRLDETPRLKFTALERPPQSLDGITGVVADLRIDLTPEWEAFLARAALASLPVYHVKQLTEAFTGRVDMDHLSENTFGAILPAQIYPVIKRTIDLVGCLLLAPAVLFLVAVSACLIKWETNGPIFFWQQRVGHRGNIFHACKLRTMTHGADQEGPLFTAENDPRVTRVGAWLRKYRIDELPQIYNIVRSEMSWIGPRPEAAELSHWYEKEVPFYVYRHIVRPGISGWAQVHQGNVAAPDAAKEKLEYDFFYIKHLSFWLDVVIVIKTLKTIITGFGSR